MEDYDDFMKGIKIREALILKNKLTGAEILVTHGHQGDFTNEQLWYLNKLVHRYGGKFVHAFRKREGVSAVRKAYIRSIVERNYRKWIKKHRVMLICGHTHSYSFPRPENPPYFNTGCCIAPANITGLEITAGKIQLVSWVIDPEGKSSREIIGGPEPLEKFNLR